MALRSGCMARSSAASVTKMPKEDRNVHLGQDQDNKGLSDTIEPYDYKPRHADHLPAVWVETMQNGGTAWQSGTHRTSAS